MMTSSTTKTTFATPQKQDNGEHEAYLNNKNRGNKTGDWTFYDKDGPMSNKEPVAKSSYQQSFVPAPENQDSMIDYQQEVSYKHHRTVAPQNQQPYNILTGQPSEYTSDNRDGRFTSKKSYQQRHQDKESFNIITNDRK